MTILYSLIADIRQNFLGQYPSNKKNITDTAKIILSKIPATEHKQSYSHELYNFHYKCSGEFVYMCITTQDFPLRISFAFLDDIELHHLRTRDSSGFDFLIRDKMAHFNNLDNDKISALKKDVDFTKEILLQNVEKVIDRGVKLDQLVEDSNSLSNTSIKFAKKGKTLASRMCWRNILIVIVLAAVALIGLFFIIWFICEFPNFSRCEKWFSKK